MEVAPRLQCAFLTGREKCGLVSKLPSYGGQASLTVSKLSHRITAINCTGAPETRTFKSGVTPD